MVAEMKKVDSSQIDAMGHDPVENVMRVAFKNNTVYTYRNVPKDVFDSIFNAPSVGKAFTGTIKANPTTYPFSKEV